MLAPVQIQSVYLSSLNSAARRPPVTCRPALLCKFDTQVIPSTTAMGKSRVSLLQTLDFFGTIAISGALGNSIVCSSTMYCSNSRLQLQYEMYRQYQYPPTNLESFTSFHTAIVGHKVGVYQDVLVNLCSRAGDE